MRHLAILSILLVFGGCAGSPAGRLTLPERNTLVRGQLEIHGDFPLAAHHRLFEELTAQREELCSRLSLPRSDEPIHVYLFEDPDRFQEFVRLTYPVFSGRRAFFVESDVRLSVYARWGDRIAEDLRHEVTHGYLHSVAPNIPLWLDEGIAEYFEVPRGNRGLNRRHLQLLTQWIEREQWRPDLRRLERLDSGQDMTQDDYAQSWAWVHFLMESRPECLELLRSYLSDLRRDGIAAPLSARLAAMIGRPEEALVEHVCRLAPASAMAAMPTGSD